MKNLFLVLTLIIFVSCNNQTEKNNNSIIGIKFQNYNQINQLKNYTKVSDTVIYENNTDPKCGILHLRDKKSNLVVFKGISHDATEKITFEILDTLIIPNSSKPEFITIDYCRINEANNENLIAVVDKTDSLLIQNIKKAWKANTVSEKIESLNNIQGINCYNEWFLQH